MTASGEDGDLEGDKRLADLFRMTGSPEPEEARTAAFALCKRLRDAKVSPVSIARLVLDAEDEERRQAAYDRAIRRNEVLETALRIVRERHREDARRAERVLGELCPRCRVRFTPRVAR